MIPEPGSLDLMLTNGLVDVTGSVGTTFIIEIGIIAIGHFFPKKNQPILENVKQSGVSFVC